jgi:xanthine dehydrogenase YagR molybdenum-binding subunit
MSYALFENRLLDRQTGHGQPQRRQYKIGRDGRSGDRRHIVPAGASVTTLSVGIGEPATVATAAAIANAVSHAVGARIRHLPITPETVLAAVEEARQTGRLA